MSTPADISGIEQALNQNDKFDIKKIDTLVDKAEELVTQRLPEKHEFDRRATEKMVEFQRRNSKDLVDASEKEPAPKPQ